MSSPTAYYLPVDEDTFHATEATVGPWGQDAQHGGPPAALLARALERVEPRDGMQLARVTVEILGPVPTPADLRVNAKVVRPGRRVELVEATMAHEDRVVMTARGWRIAAATRAASLDDAPAPPRPDHDEPGGELPGGFIHSLEWRWVHGHFREPGGATVWARQRVPLVAGETPSPWQRTMCLADCGNGISGHDDPARLLFINPELTVHLFRQPQGEWLCLEAVTRIAAGGTGLATSRLFDENGLVGHGAQALLIASRG